MWFTFLILSGWPCIFNRMFLSGNTITWKLFSTFIIISWGFISISQPGTFQLCKYLSAIETWSQLSLSKAHVFLSYVFSIYLSFIFSSESIFIYRSNEVSGDFQPKATSKNLCVIKLGFSKTNLRCLTKLSFRMNCAKPTLHSTFFRLLNALLVCCVSKPELKYFPSHWIWIPCPDLETPVERSISTRDKIAIWNEILE